MSSRIVQVTNVSSSVLKDQLRSLFATLGRIEEIQLYPESETLASTISAKVGYVKFERSESERNTKGIFKWNISREVFANKKDYSALRNENV